MKHLLHCHMTSGQRGLLNRKMRVPGTKARAAADYMVGQRHHGDEAAQIQIMASGDGGPSHCKRARPEIENGISGKYRRLRTGLEVDIYSTLNGHVAEWLRNGLQNRVPRFNSGRGLHKHSARA
jgi:hypothetical protein